jgi:hypothetical protein
MRWHKTTDWCAPCRDIPQRDVLSDLVCLSVRPVPLLFQTLGHLGRQTVPCTPACYHSPMCGRYTMTVDQRTVERHFGAKFISGRFEHYEPIYNASPSQMHPIIRTYYPDRIELAKWGTGRTHPAAEQRPPRDRQRKTDAPRQLPRPPMPLPRRLLL